MYQEDLDNIWKCCSECWKLSVYFQECQPLITGIERATLAIVSIFYSLPKTQGDWIKNMQYNNRTQNPKCGGKDHVRILLNGGNQGHKYLLVNEHLGLAESAFMNDKMM